MKHPVLPARSVHEQTYDDHARDVRVPRAERERQPTEQQDDTEVHRVAHVAIQAVAHDGVSAVILDPGVAGEIGILGRHVPDDRAANGEQDPPDRLRPRWNHRPAKAAAVQCHDHHQHEQQGGVDTHHESIPRFRCPGAGCAREGGPDPCGKTATSAWIRKSETREERPTPGHATRPATRNQAAKNTATAANLLRMRGRMARLPGRVRGSCRSSAEYLAEGQPIILLIRADSRMPAARPSR